MFKLTKLTDYAIVLMSEMAAHPGVVRTGPQLAERTGVPVPTVAKLLKTLTAAGVMLSHRGATGGYVLARPATEISIAEIITALEGPIALTACVDGAEGGCGVESFCPMRGNWDKINLAVRTALEGLTLADMATPAAPPMFGLGLPMPEHSPRSEA
ncbi:MAG: SUF system Fe-S cluster assembly regulator [Azospirillaceae bacterium]|nr:SUF system Fe-S cluster assembly regulator [Azospirillaceae bacterium]